MQLLALQHLIAMTSFAYHTASALAVPFRLPAQHNQTVTEAVLISLKSPTNLTDSEFWPIEGNYWLEIDKSNIHMDLQYVHSVLTRAYRALEKQPADLKLEGILSVKADRTREPYNEDVFEYAAIPRGESTMGEAFMALKGITAWYQQEPLQEKRFATYFYLTDQGEGGRGVFGYGAMKRKWQPFPPSLGGNVSVSR